MKQAGEVAVRLRRALTSAGAGSSVSFCTLAIHAPYRRRARRLCLDVGPVPFVVLTDEPADFADLPVRAVHHVATGPMAIDYAERPAWTGATYDGRGAAAYHDKRFVLRLALEHFDTAIFLDADSRVRRLPRLGEFPPGLAVRPREPESVEAHLRSCGPARLPAFEDLARELMGTPAALGGAIWCEEACYAVTRDGRESAFFAAWDFAAGFLQNRGVYSGEGGVMGLAAAHAGWSVDHRALGRIASCVHHEGGGPKLDGP